MSCPGVPKDSLPPRQDIKKCQRKIAALKDQQRQLRALAAHALLAEEKERRRLADRMHDELGALLATSCMKLGDLVTGESSPQTVQTIAGIRTILEQAIKETQSMTFELASPILYELGLGDALEQLCEQMQEEYGLAWTVEWDQQAGTDDLDLRSVLFRGARELLYNVVKHSQARHVKLTLRAIGHQMELTVEDDGIGFDVAKAGCSFSAAGGFGLFSLRQRLQHFGGRLRFAGAPGKGVRASMSCPLSVSPSGKNRDPDGHPEDIEGWGAHEIGNEPTGVSGETKRNKQ